MAHGGAGSDDVDAALILAQIADHAIVATDLAGTITSWNAGAERLTGYAPEEAVGRVLAMVFVDEDCLRGVPAGLLDLAAAQGRSTHEGWWVRRDGTRLWADTGITALRRESDVDGHPGGEPDRRPDGEVVGFAVVTRDHTDRKRVEEQQASFLGSIGHDFRTPITAMKGFTELVRDASEDQREDFLRRIDANADRLMQMMENLVGYAAVHAVGTEGRPEVFDLAALARETVLSMGSQAELARVVLPTGEGSVHADRASLERIITNLVGNALKYSAHGPVNVDVCSGGDRVRLTVSDEGRGIDPDDLAVIFDEFQRGRLSTPDGGTGLGLASVKRLAEEQGGQVHLQSVVGQGTVVTVELPALDGSAADAVATA